MVNGEEFKNVRAVVSFINENNIKREDIVSLINKDQMLYLIYYMS